MVLIVIAVVASFVSIVAFGANTDNLYINAEAVPNIEIWQWLLKCQIAISIDSIKRITQSENIKGEKLKQIYEGSEKEFLIKNLKKNSTYEIGIYSVYEHLISQKI